MKKIKPSLLIPLKQPPLATAQPQPGAAATTKIFNFEINRLSSQGAHHEVLFTYSSMLTTNTPPDRYTFPSLIKACTSLLFLSFGLSIHQRLIVNGFSSDAYIASSLINFYAKFYLTDNARRVFDMMFERDVVHWTAIIGCYSYVGNVDNALFMFNEMRHQGIEPSSVTLLSLLSGVAEISHLQCLHCCLICYGFLSDTALSNTMLNAYGKFGSIESAKKLFDFMDKRDMVSWNSLISGYAQVVDLRKIMNLLYTMRIQGMDPDQQTFASLVSAATTLGNLLSGKLVHSQILRARFDSDVRLDTSLIIMYLKCGDIDSAFHIFERSVHKDVVLWTAMTSGLVQNDCPEKALLVFCQMLKSRVEPSTATMASALAACAQLGSSRLGTSIHGYILRQGMTLDIPAQNSLITMYAKCGLLKQSCVVFERIEEKDLVSWNALISGYAQNGHLDRALFFFNEMRTISQRTNSITVVSILQACASIGALHQGRWVHSFSIRSFLRPNILIETALVDMYSKCGDLDAAQKCFNGMSSHDLVSWSTIIAAYGCHSRGDTAMRLYSEFLNTGLEPNHVIFLSVLSACSHNGLCQEGLSIFKSMKTDYGIEPKFEHRACIVDLLSRAGRVEEAYNFYKKVFPQPVIEVLGILLDACRTSCNMDLSGVIARDILMLRPQNVGNYLQVAHSYASMKKWDDVGEAWTHMRSLGLKKLPGWSFLELHGIITTFYSYHDSHPEFGKIVSILKTLCREMKKSTNFVTSHVDHIY